jgi:glycosyltransferase involved in cell wall biosynthesis
MIGVLRRAGTLTAVICHNVLPHERSRVDKLLVGSLLSATDRVVVHTDHEAELARALTDRPVCVAELAPFLPSAFVQGRPRPGVHRRLLFFGLVRPYKGLDVLIRALAACPEAIELRVAGEFWGGTDSTTRLVEELHLENRVELRPGYVRADDVPGLFEDVDALVLPYRTATGSQGVGVAFEFGVPVIVSRAGALADVVRDGVDGIIAEPDDVDSMAQALERFYANGTPETLRRNVRPIDPDPLWSRYIETLISPGDDL